VGVQWVHKVALVEHWAAADWLESLELTTAGSQWLAPPATCARDGTVRAVGRPVGARTETDSGLWALWNRLLWGAFLVAQHDVKRGKIGAPLVLVFAAED